MSTQLSQLSQDSHLEYALGRHCSHVKDKDAESQHRGRLALVTRWEWQHQEKEKIITL